MKKLFLAIAVIAASLSSNAQNTIDITGKVKFPDNRAEYNGRTFDFDFIMQIFKRDGQEKIVIAEAPVNPDGSYALKMKVDAPGVYTLQCSLWEQVNFWAEDENLEVDFRGRDTAKVIIKNPPYVHIKGGPLNEVMNHSNFNIFRSYQMMIGVSGTMYRAKFENEEAKGVTTDEGYKLISADNDRVLNFLGMQYADRNSVLSLLNRIPDKTLVTQIEEQFEKTKPNYAPYLAYKQAKKDKAEAELRNATGQKAPDFSCPTPDGKANIALKDFKGKLVIVDFWASWCGPCRSEIPHLKEAYEMFDRKDVEFLSVSIDKDQKAWLKALGEENMPWPQVLAPNAGKEVMKDYNFSGIPYVILVDRDGNIAAKQLRGAKVIEAIQAELKGGKKAKSIPAAGMSMSAM